MRFLLSLLLPALLTAMPALAQDAVPVIPQAQAEIQPQTQTEAAPAGNVESPPVDDPPSYEQKPYAILQTLDKLTARTNTVTLPVGKPSAVGPIFIDVKTCQKTLPTEQPEAAAFLQIWEAKPKSKEKRAAKNQQAGSQWVFSGWMFASSPALSAMNHPVYDVWLKDCINAPASDKQK